MLAICQWYASKFDFDFRFLSTAFSLRMLLKYYVLSATTIYQPEYNTEMQQK